MKQITILSGRCLVAELPEGANRFTVFNDDCPYLSFFAHAETPRVYLPSGNWRIIGMLSEVTEEQAEGLVEWNEVLQYYPDYSMDGLWNGDITALESLDSAITAEGYSFTNSLGNEKEYKKKYKGHPMFFANHMAKWFEAQSRVLCRERCLLLRRVG